MPAMLRRRAGFLGKMALEVAYQCLDGLRDVPTVFASRHGEVARAVELFADLAQEIPVSPTTFGLAVHNASAGLFSIARKDHANHIALAAGCVTVEHAVIEACGLLADGAIQVLLVVYDCPLPTVFSEFQDCAEQAHAFAWLMVAAAPATPDTTASTTLELSWQADSTKLTPKPDAMPASLQVLRFQLSNASQLERHDGTRRWCWSKHA